MSTTDTRLPLDTAARLAAWLRTRWGMDTDAHSILGSVRRQRPDIGDIELCAPLPNGGADPLHDRIAASLGLAGPSIFGQVEAPRVDATHVSGLKPNFKCAKLVYHGKSGQDVKIEIHRYTPQNKGWVELHRTGSEEFAVAVLAQWKVAHGIRGERQGSVDGHLVRYSAEHPDTPEVVPVPTERHVFLGAGLIYVEPREREDAGALLSPFWWTSRVPALEERARKAMVRLGVRGWQDLNDRWDELRGWCHMDGG